MEEIKNVGLKRTFWPLDVDVPVDIFTRLLR
jgi:hypothetical protein